MRISKSHKVTAFTLSEMVVVLIVSSIVIGLAFTILTLVQKHMQQIRINYDNTLQLNTLKQALTIDFNTYSTIEYNNDYRQLHFKHAIDSMTYHFHQTYIVRDKDTFRFKELRAGFYFNGDKVEEGQIDALKFSIDSTNVKTAFIYKNNTSSNYTN